MRTPSSSGLTRRNFLRRGSAAALTLSVLPASVMGLRAGASPNSRLNLAGIGLGGQGASDLRQMESENIVALCDVDRAHAGSVFKKYSKAKQFTDYRQMLDEMPEIDAIVVATPDHHHAFASMEGIKRRKHVYCEKPLTHSVWEARRLRQAAAEAGLATQMGNQGQASLQTRRLCELVWSGLIGEVREAHIWTDRPSRGLFEEYWPQGVPRPGETPPVPATLDWDLWLGPAPQRPYHPIYHPFRWRGWWDFGTGALGDIGCHAMDPVFRALKLGAPLSVQAASTRVNQESFPLGSMVTYEFPARGAESQSPNTHVKGLTGRAAGGVAMPACKLVWYDGGLRPPRPEALPQAVLMGDNGRLLIGSEGFILNDAAYRQGRLSPAGDVPPSIPPSPGHYEEWLRACKGDAAGGSNFDWAGPLAESVLLGNVALRPQLREDLTLGKLLWNSPDLRITNLEEANQFVRREYRVGWTL